MQFSQLFGTLPLAFLGHEKKNNASKKLAKFAHLFSSYEIEHGKLTLALNSEKHSLLGKQDNPNLNANIQLNQPLKFLWNLYTKGELGFAKSYIENDINSEDLHTLLTFGHLNSQAFETLDKGFHPIRSLTKVWNTTQHNKRHNSRKNARKNIAAHYDLGNDFYQLWLDESMTYSSAYYRNQDETLGQAQQEKIERILDELNLQAGQAVLEIGCGWGSFAAAAAKRGINVKGLTLSTEQQAHANQQFSQLPTGSGNAKAHLQDYRDEQEQYDAIVSIEMFEAVGVNYWQTYFETLKRCLKPGGKALLQIITFEGNEKEISDYQNGSDYIQTYIFPGGVLPAKTQLETLANNNHFSVKDTFCFGRDYATTLAQWREQFHAVTDDLEQLGYDERFRRMWDYYLVYCQVGFEQDRLDVVHLLLENNN